MIEEERMEHPDWDEDKAYDFIIASRGKQLMERINDQSHA
jgi:hypothetical protein